MDGGVTLKTEMEMEMETAKETYEQFKARLQDEFGAFDGIFYAYNDSQFDAGMAKIGLNNDKKDLAKIKRLRAGGYIRKDRIDSYILINANHKKNLKDFLEKGGNLLDALVTELRNHEYCYSHDPLPAIEVLGMRVGDIDSAILSNAMMLTCEEK